MIVMYVNLIIERRKLTKALGVTVFIYSTGKNEVIIIAKTS